MQAALLEHGSIRSAALALGMPKSTFSDRARQWNLQTSRQARGLLRKRQAAATPSLPVTTADDDAPQSANADGKPDVQATSIDGERDAHVASMDGAPDVREASLGSSPGASLESSRASFGPLPGAMASGERLPRQHVGLESPSFLHGRAATVPLGASLESSPDGDEHGRVEPLDEGDVVEVLADTVGLDEPPAAEAGIDVPVD
jgi:hypothetical protein